ncbi:MAG: PD-(D/E)XK nuclease family protein [Candidatus Eremiobacteraeota bacterium]|nr:PD-(D/E)XK nuclease family protein [Candidatus Eremiobacteraeota bacterium]
MKPTDALTLGDEPGGIRELIALALASGDWPWALSLRTDDAFIDGLALLVEWCAHTGVSELSLAAAVADEHAERSALARLLLLNAHRFRVESRAAEDAQEPRSPRLSDPTAVDVTTLAVAWEWFAESGIADVVMRRDAARGVAPSLAQRVRVGGSAPPHARTGALVFEDDPDSRAMLVAWALEPERAPQPALRRQVRVGAPSSVALARWFAELDAGPEVWEWPDPEPFRPLVAPPMTFSASRLNGFVKCPRRWFYEYLCDAVADEGSAAATYGKVFHEALEALHRMIKRPADFSGNFILERLHEELDLAFARNESEFASRLELEVSRSRARGVAAHYVRWLSSQAREHPMQVEAVESLQRWTMGGYEFVGFIDRIDRPVEGGPITIYDYKTGRIEQDPNEFVASVRRGDEAQLALYYTVRRMRGDDVGRLALVSLRDPRDPVWVLALDMTDDEGRAVEQRDERSGVVRAMCRPSDIAAGVDALLARADLLTKQGLEHYEPGTDPPCMHCDYARACRERPDDGERVFAR